MQSTDTMGLILVAISAMLLAAHWQQWRHPELRLAPSHQRRRFHQLMIRRRLVANLLVGFVGFSLVAFDSVPRTPLSMTAFLLCLVIAAAWIMWLGLADWRASRRFQEQQQLDHLAIELQRSGAVKKLTDT